MKRFAQAISLGVLLVAAWSVQAQTPTTPHDYNNRGDARFAKGDHDGAIADYTKAIEIDPRVAGPYAGRGLARQAKGDLDGAIADYTKAIEIDPHLALAYYYRGVARLANSDLD